ncbi:hypothetical protein PG995_000198 [Apiospora arundinis]
MNPQSCIACGKSGGLACTGCLLAFDSQHSIFKAVYCSKECQTAHWPQHKAFCTSRKAVGRAAFLLRDLFLLYKDFSYSDCLIQLREENGILYSILGDHDEDATKGRTIIRQFPRELAPAVEDYQAYLMMQECSFIFSTFKCIVDFILDPICRQIDEVEVYTRNVHRPVVVMQSGNLTSGMLKNHYLLRVKLPSGEDVAVDLTGAQFGWKEPVSPWAAWEDQRAYGAVTTHYRGYISDSKEDQDEKYKIASTWYGKVRPVWEGQIKAMLGAIVGTIKKQQPGTNGSVAKFLRSRDYDDARSEMMKAARKSLAACLHEVLVSNTMRMYWTPEWEYQVTVTKAQSEHLKKVWLSDAEYEENKHDVSLLNDIWMRRCLDKKIVDGWLPLGLCISSEHSVEELIRLHAA